MIPLFIRLRIRKNGRKVLSLRFPVILVLIPVILLLAALLPIVLVAALLASLGGYGGMVLRSYALVFTVLFLLSGLRIEVEDAANEVAIILQ
jgi:hypothetical protein